MYKINKEHLIGAVCLIIGVTTLILTRSFPQGEDNIQLTGPAFFPNVLAIILLFIGNYEIVVGFLKNKNKRKDEEHDKIALDLKNAKVTTVIVISLMIVFFIIFLDIIGFFTTSFIFLMVILLKFRIKWWKCLLTSAIFLGVVFLVFQKLFTISLPSGFLV